MNLNAVLGEAITKGALRVTRNPIAALRHDVASLKRQVAELHRLLRRMQKDVGRHTVQAVAPKSVPGNALRIRPTGPMVRKLRKRLGLTQAEFAKLAGVSSLTVSKWECAAGRIRLRSRTLAAFAKVREMGKQAAKAVLASGA